MEIFIDFKTIKNDDFQLRKIYDRIYLLTFEKQYDLNMHFMRAQEFYESSDDRFRGKTFKLLDFMRWYSIEREGSNGTFTYVNDWTGFNVPSWVLEELYVKQTVSDENQYDITMRAIYETLYNLEKVHAGFYIIGCLDKSSTLDHEFAHGLFYVDDEYRNEQLENIQKLVKKYGKAAKNACYSALVKEGYCADVLADETQAYLATGILPKMESYLADMGIQGRKLTWFKRGFRNTFERYTKQAKLPWRTVMNEI